MLSAGGLDSRQLGSWLAANVSGFVPPVSLERFQGGQSNPTYLVTDGAGARYVLRKKPEGELLPSAHAVDREFRVMAALGDSEVPVARALGYCGDAGVIGTPFYVMAFVEGRVLWDPALPGSDNTERTAIYDEMNRVIAALHRIDPAAVGLADYGRSGNFFERQIGRWTRQYQASVIEPIAAMERLIEWLPAHVPPSDETRVFHGDLRLDNMIFHPTEPRVLAVLDWELSTLGHPLADFAYHALPWRLTAAQFRGMAGADYAALGIPDERSYLNAYCRRTGRAPVDPAHWEFYLAYSMFRLAAILQGILKRAADGTASSAQAKETGARARPIAEAAWRQVEAHFPCSER
ncbi:MAG: phosphotransferase family protein [Variovorax sp.]|nr:MAG: phosphotransferase family protein [Variovorax sp.]